MALSWKQQSAAGGEARYLDYTRRARAAPVNGVAEIANGRRWNAHCKPDVGVGVILARIAEIYATSDARLPCSQGARQPAPICDLGRNGRPGCLPACSSSHRRSLLLLQVHKLVIRQESCEPPSQGRHATESKTVLMNWQVASCRGEELTTISSTSLLSLTTIIITSLSLRISSRHRPDSPARNQGTTIQLMTQ